MLVICLFDLNINNDFHYIIVALLVMKNCIKGVKKYFTNAKKKCQREEEQLQWYGITITTC